MVKRPLCILCFIFLAAVTGMVCLVQPNVLQKKQPVTVVGEIYYRENGTNSSIFYLKDTFLKSDSYSNESQNLIIYLSKSFNYPIGTILKLEGTMYPLETASNPGQFDTHFYYRAKGIGGRIQGTDVQVLKEGPDNYYCMWKEHLLKGKEEWCTRLRSLFGEEAAGILQAMLFGVTSEVSEELEELYQLLGIGHLLAVSGLHISLLGGVLYKGMRRLGLPFWASCAAASLSLFSYQEMLGFRGSALRAVGMFFLFLGAQMTGRAYDRLTALAFAAACLAWYQPLLVLTGGFWLSLTATLGAAIGIERKEEKKRCDKAMLSEAQSKSVNRRESILQKASSAWNSISVVFYIQIITLPVQLYFYYELAVYGVFWNLLLVPAAGLVLTGGIMALVLSYVWFPLGVFAGGMAELVLLFYQLAGYIGGKLPGAVYLCGKPEVWQMAVYYTLLSGWMYFGWPREQLPGDQKGEIKNKQRICCLRLTGILFFGAVFSLVFLRFHAPLEVDFLDVGQGDCVVVREEDGLCMLVDGGSSDVDQVWKYRIYPFLKHEKIPVLDYVFVSHGDMDHISGLLELFEQNRISVRYLVCYANASEKLDELKAAAWMRGTKVVDLSAGNGLKTDTISVTCLGPETVTDGEKSEQVSENDQSLILLLESRGVRFLFTGDMEKAEEQMVLQGMLADELDADVLKVAHHGSSGSSSEELLERITPVISIISCGKDNAYGHPHEETLVRLREVGSDIFVTEECGAVMVSVEDGKIAVERWKGY